ncbi:metal ion transporter [Rhizophagus irregularis DAOM 181602=DAOM 197198]|nr:metal ion transporter [Rhizophagus irregularis DAOM 181602=DAOM 197198]
MTSSLKILLDKEKVDAFRVLVLYMSDFTKENVIMVINEREIKLLYEEANKGKVFGTLKDIKEISSINIINDRNHFILKFQILRLLQALEAMDNKSNVKMELKIIGETTILLFETNCDEKSASKFKVEIVGDNRYRQNPPPISRRAIKFNDSDLYKLLKMARLFSKIKDNLLVSVQHNTNHHIFKIKYSLDTGSKMCHQVKYRRKDQNDVRSSDVTAVKSRLFATFFKLANLGNVSCFVKQHEYILLEAENLNDENIGIKDKKMSFGRPPNISTFKPTPPEKGSFPLDHEGNNGNCRHLSKTYLKCRMDKGLMTPEEMKNLGFQDDEIKRTEEK